MLTEHWIQFQKEIQKQELMADKRANDYKSINSFLLLAISKGATVCLHVDKIHMKSHVSVPERQLMTENC